MEGFCGVVICLSAANKQKPIYTTGIKKNMFTYKQIKNKVYIIKYRMRWQIYLDFQPVCDHFNIHHIKIHQKKRIITIIRPERQNIIPNISVIFNEMFILNIDTCSESVCCGDMFKAAEWNEAATNRLQKCTLK